MGTEQFKEQVLPLRAQLLSYAGRLLDDGDEAEDIVQDVYMKLWLLRDELGSYNSITALATKITKNLCLNRLKEFQREHESLDVVDAASEAPTPAERLEQKDNLRHLMNALAMLPDLQRNVLRLRHLEGMEIDKIAELTGSAPEAVRVNLSRARKRIKELFYNIEQR
ncbi:MAG: RNA polymerase sigma factor [Tannerella sp.]|jgi:RNA polymerase sigma-70 factor (ECF subfamily)|nr:RNA polymerase sigma factor [Tannerella sp.]